MTLEGRTAIVTGGASGMGLAVSQRLAADGAAVAVFDVDAAAANQLAKDLESAGHDAMAVEVDVSDRAQIDSAVNAVRERFGPIHILVNSAGISRHEDFQDITLDTWNRVIAVNLTGTFHCVQSVIPDMVAAGWGRIVNISSSGAQSGSPRMAHYVSSKAGVMGLTKVLALEFGKSGITVNNIPPGTIDTPMLRGDVSAGNLRSPQLEEFGKTLPVGRIGRPEDIAAACAFLVSDEAGYITGQTINVNGGRYMG